MEYCVGHALVLVLIGIYWSSSRRVEIYVAHVLHQLGLLGGHGGIGGTESLCLSAISRS